jgi:hypothetical protein
MSRLIDADKLIQEMSEWYWDKEKQKVAENDVSPMDLFTHLAITTVQEQPTAFDADKVVEQLKTKKTRTAALQKASEYFEGETDAFEVAIKIVKDGES